MNESKWDSSATYIVIPAYNEGPMIETVLEDVLQIGCPVVVVDDGSRDDTYSRVAALQSGRSIHLLRHLINLGQGAALATGIQYALLKGAKIIVTFDADGQHRVEDIPNLVEPVAAGQVEVALGSRFLAGAQEMPTGRRILLKAAIFFTGLTERIWLTDAHNGFRALSAQAASQIQITQNRMAHASEIVSEIARLKLSYIEVPVHVRYTEYSRQKGQRAADALNILIELIEEHIP
ncbi:MAG: glycosyltransferase family 2 protein [Anaerolineales bacterium]|jgi:glycosyltransferase involved in cell wall biosynthesis|nr:glycosyltransferase family 2 protein [Anaerolineales bacterium]